eukprot:s2245_g10.t1
MTRYAVFGLHFVAVPSFTATAFPCPGAAFLRVGEAAAVVPAAAEAGQHLFISSSTIVSDDTGRILRLGEATAGAAAAAAAAAALAHQQAEELAATVPAPAAAAAEAAALAHQQAEELAATVPAPAAAAAEAAQQQQPEFEAAVARAAAVAAAVAVAAVAAAAAAEAGQHLFISSSSVSRISNKKK